MLCHSKLQFLPSKLSTCQCGEKFNITHALHCVKYGCTDVRHNKIQEGLASLRNELFSDVTKDPKVQPHQAKKSLHINPLALMTTLDWISKLIDSGNMILWDCFRSRIFQPLRVLCPEVIKDAYSNHEDAYSNHKLNNDSCII